MTKRGRRFMTAAMIPLLSATCVFNFGDVKPKERTHDYVLSYEVEATATQDGYYHYSCKDCASEYDVAITRVAEGR